MWDDPHALRRLSDTLFGVALLLLLFIGLAYVIRQPAFALRTVQLDTAPQRADRQHLAEAVRGSLVGNFFTVNLDRARHAFEQVPWVRSVSVRRHFPWQLDVALQEYTALGRWNGKDLLSVHGEVFSGQSMDPLPEFTGPDEAAAEMAGDYDDFSAALAQLGLKITRISFSSRHACQLHLDNGMVLKLGREQKHARLARFVAAYPEVSRMLKTQPKYVDLRYRNGFAVGVNS